MVSAAHNSKHAVFLSVCLCLWFTPARAAAPKVEHLFPSGAQAGQTIDVTAIGSFDPWPPLAWTSSAKIQVRPGKDKGKLAVEVAPGAAPGVYWIRLYNQEGASAPRPFVVGDLPEVLEKEPNNTLEHAQAVDRAATINGRLDLSEDLDAFAIQLEKGQTLVASLEANRHLLSPMDGILQLVSSRGFVLEQNDDDHERDPQIVYTATEAGTYVIRLFAFTIPPNQSIRFASGKTYVYRLTVTTDAFVDHLFPAAVPRGLACEVELHGWNVPSSLRRLLLVGSHEDAHLPVRHSRLGNTPRARLVSHPVTVEDEDSTSGPPQTIGCPSTLTGRIDPPRDVDLYRFDAGKGESVLFEIEARRLGSPIDTVLRIRDAAGKELSRTDDSGGPDPRINFKAPADGEYSVEVTDLFAHGGARYVYALHMTRARPDYRLTLGADQFVLTPGKELEIPVSVSRENGFSGEVEIGAIGLPGGVTCPSARSAAKGDASKSAKLKLTASAGPFSGVIRILGKEVGAADEVRRATYATGGWNDPRDLVWLTVLEPPKAEKAEKAEKEKEAKKGSGN